MDSQSGRFQKGAYLSYIAQQVNIGSTVWQSSARVTMLTVDMATGGSVKPHRRIISATVSRRHANPRSIVSHDTSAKSGVMFFRGLWIKTMPTACFLHINGYYITNQLSPIVNRCGFFLKEKPICQNGTLQLATLKIL
jgi:hypothetical protein